VIDCFTSHTGHKICHFGDVLPGQSLSLVVQKLNLIQHKQIIQEQNDKNTQKANRNLKKTETRTNVNFKNCSYVCAYHCVQLSYIHTIQHRTVLIIFPFIPGQSSLLRYIYWREGAWNFHENNYYQGTCWDEKQNRSNVGLIWVRVHGLKSRTFVNRCDLENKWN